MSDDKTMRSFDSGATRDTADGKLDMDGFTHPMVLKQFAKYMNMNRLQSDGKLRDSDNWQKGIPMDAYMKSLRRHYDDLWAETKGFPSEPGPLAAMCGIMFNVMGYMLEYLKINDFKLQDFDGDEPTPEIKKRQAGVSRDRNESDHNQKLLTAGPIHRNVSHSAWQQDVTPLDKMKELDDQFLAPIIKAFEQFTNDEKSGFDPDLTGYCLSDYTSTLCNDCFTQKDCLGMILRTNMMKIEELHEELEDVPELPVCFGFCNNGDETGCENCKDHDVCDDFECYGTDDTPECQFHDDCTISFNHQQRELIQDG